MTSQVAPARIEPVHAEDVALRGKATLYPAPFASLVTGRQKRTLGDRLGLQNFGVNLTTLAPGALSALKHVHSAQDEFVYVLDGTLTLLLADREYPLSAGDCVGFPAGRDSHCLVSRGSSEATYLDIGDRTPERRRVLPGRRFSGSDGP